MHYFDELHYTKIFNDLLALRDLAKNTQDSYRSFLHCYLSRVDNTLQKAPEEVSQVLEFLNFVIFLIRILIVKICVSM